MKLDMANGSYYKTFLVCSNVVLLFVGLSVLILGLKMKWALSMLLLINIPIILDAVNAVIATGFFISLSGFSGICGACSENKWLVVGHLVSLGVIVIMEFSLGVTLMIVKKTVSTAMDSPDCNNVCSASIDAAILDYALPSAGLMMSVIFVEALMMYSSIKLYFYIRDHPKPIASAPPFAVQSVQMHNVSGSQSTYVTTPQQQPSPRFDFSPYHSPQSYIHQVTPQVVSSVQTTVEDKPPDYDSLPQQSSLYLSPRPRSRSRTPSENSEPKEDSSDGTFNQV